MANRPKRPYRREYLNDFRQDSIGNYVYTGKVYVFCGDKSLKRTYLLRAIILWCVALVATVVPELFPPVKLSKSAFLLLPWLFQLVFIVLTGWCLIRLTAHSDELREYVYKATVEKTPRRSAASAIASFLTLIAAIVIVLAERISIDSAGTAVRIIGPIIAALSSLMLFFSIRSGKWEEKH